jgi:hypothetical protein
MKKNFRIEWTDPESGEPRTEDKTFEDTPNITAREWAEDWAYTVADKGYAKITEIKCESVQQ